MKKLLFILTFLFFLLAPSHVFAQSNTNCSNRYVTLVNPVRARNLWQNKNASSLASQYSIIKQKNLPATWLLQYDVFFDKKVLQEVKSFDFRQERGLFLEISPKLAMDSRVIYPSNTLWYFPNSVFLSAYSQSERIRMIEEVFTKFKKAFGYYPKSVGAWWIDSYSLNYMVGKYGIKTAMIVADQKETDGYSVFGQWWGVPYYPSKANILTPASNIAEKQDITVIQWAERDLTKAYGAGPAFSNFSVQSTDYTTKSLDTKYFNKLVGQYLDCANSLGQITVGVETGVDKKVYLEYEKQLDELVKYPSIKFSTMQQFSSAFNKTYPQFPKEIVLSDETSVWTMTPGFRENKYLKDYVSYNQQISFQDYFVKDGKRALERVLSSKSTQREDISGDFFIFLSILASFFAFYKLRKLDIWFAAILFIVACFGLLLRSEKEFGWLVFYGPVVGNLLLFQLTTIFLTFVLFFVLNKLFSKINLLFIPLAFGIDFLISLPRYIQLGDDKYVGVSLDALRFIGISFSKSSFNFVNKDFISYQAASFLKFDFSKIWDNSYLSFLIYPFLHLGFGLILYFIYKNINPKLRKPFIFIFVILYLSWVYFIFSSDPRVVRN